VKILGNYLFIVQLAGRGGFYRLFLIFLQMNGVK